MNVSILGVTRTEQGSCLVGRVTSTAVKDCPDVRWQPSSLAIVPEQGSSTTQELEIGTPCFSLCLLPVYVIACAPCLLLPGVLWVVAVVSTARGVAARAPAARVGDNGPLPCPCPLPCFNHSYNHSEDDQAGAY